jgi:plasmid stabilization system protein ParE
VKTITIERPARADMQTAEKHYQDVRRGLKEEFRLCLEEALDRIQLFPESYPIVTGRNLRRALLHRFPYGILYRSEPDVVRVFGVVHTSENPQKWNERAH